MTDGGPAPEVEPPLDGRVLRQIERMADGRRITYYAWRADVGDADDGDAAGDR